MTDIQEDAYMINTINGILEAAKGGKTGVIAVAAAHDQPVIEAVVEARKEGIATPILVGNVWARTPPITRSSPVTATPTAPPRPWPCVQRVRPIS